MSQTIITEVQTVMNLEDLKRLSGLPESVFNELAELGAFDALLVDGAFVTRSVTVVRKADRLRRTFQLESSATALLIHYLEQVEELKGQLRRMGCQVGQIR